MDAELLLTPRRQSATGVRTCDVLQRKCSPRIRAPGRGLQPRETRTSALPRGPGPDRNLGTDPSSDHAPLIWFDHLTPFPPPPHTTDRSPLRGFSFAEHEIHRRATLLQTRTVGERRQKYYVPRRFDLPQRVLNGKAGGPGADQIVRDMQVGRSGLFGPELCRQITRRSRQVLRLVRNVSGTAFAGDPLQ